MGVGKAFGNSLQEYNLNEEEICKLLDETKSVVAGSFLLAAYLKENNKPSFTSNDLDFFLTDNKENIEKIKNFIQYKGYTHNLTVEEKKYKNNKDIVNFSEYKNDKNKKIQIISLKKDPIEHIKEFDLDCCKIYWDNKNKEIVSMSEDILLMKTNLNIDKIRYNTFERTTKYIDRNFKIFYDDNDITELCKFVDHFDDKFTCEEIKEYFKKDDEDDNVIVAKETLIENLKNEILKK